MYFIQHCFICRPSDSTVSEDAGIEPRTVATLALEDILRLEDYLQSWRIFSLSWRLAIQKQFNVFDVRNDNFFTTVNFSNFL
jgi:hypothetical protein